MKTYPLFLVGLDRARCVVVGGGTVAARKVNPLLRADAQVTVISPRLCRPLQGLAAGGEINVVNRPYRSGDVEGAFLVIAATDDVEINKAVWEEALALGLLVNVVDDPDRCNFIAPSVVRRGPLSLAISTAGRCPAFSRHLRKQLEREFGPAYGSFVEMLGSLREGVVRTLPIPERRAFWEDIFASDVLSLLASGDHEQADQRAQEILEHHLLGVE